MRASSGRSSKAPRRREPRERRPLRREHGRDGVKNELHFALREHEDSSQALGIRHLPRVAHGERPLALIYFLLIGFYVARAYKGAGQCAEVFSMPSRLMNPETSGSSASRVLVCDRADSLGLPRGGLGRTFSRPSDRWSNKTSCRLVLLANPSSPSYKTRPARGQYRDSTTCPGIQADAEPRSCLLQVRSEGPLDVRTREPMASRPGPAPPLTRSMG